MNTCYETSFTFVQPSFNCWKSIMVSCRQSRRLLECTEDNFLIQVIDSHTKGDVILDLMVINVSELIYSPEVSGARQPGQQ